jgi:hypothetical protein
MVLMSSSPKIMQTSIKNENGDVAFYFIAATLGIFCGLLHVGVRDPLLTALGVVSSTMFLGFMRPERPWRWVLVVGLFVPIVMSVANLVGYYRELSRAGLFGSGLIMLPGVAGAFGGHFGRRFLRVMFSK